MPDVKSGRIYNWDRLVRAIDRSIWRADDIVIEEKREPLNR
ncbi:MAG: hypothetical protein ACFFAS_09630 [Promethearchaeota archaeon]